MHYTLRLYPFLGAELGLQSMDLLDVHCNGVLCSLGNDSTVGLTQFDESKGGVGCGGGGRSSENNAIRSLPASKNRRPRFLPERDEKANFANFRLNFPKMSWSTLCCPEICNKINQYVYASLHTHHKYECFIWVNVCKPGILAVLHQAKP